MAASLIKPIFLAVMLISPGIDSSVARNFKDSQVINTEYPAWFHKDPFYDLKEALGKSRSEGKLGLMIVFGTQGCSYCSVFAKRSLGNPAIAAKLKTRFISYGMEIFDDADLTSPTGKQTSVKQFAHEQRAGFSPTVIFIDNKGQRMARIIGYQAPERFMKILDYVTTGKYKTESLASYFSKQQSGSAEKSVTTDLKNDPLFSRPPYKLGRKHKAAKQPLMVLFEKPGCNECNEFHHNVLADKNIRVLLRKFEIVRLNTSDRNTSVISPDGQRTTPAYWYKQTGFSRVPALSFFDEKGNEVLKTDALVKQQRMANSINYVLERAYEKKWTYQQFARSKAIQRSQAEKKSR